MEVLSIATVAAEFTDRDAAAPLMLAATRGGSPPVGRCMLPVSKPVLKAPGSNRLKLKYDEPLSSFGFKLRRFSPAPAALRLHKLRAEMVNIARSLPTGRVEQVDPMKPKLNAPETKRLQQKCGDMLSASAFKFNLRRYTSAHSSPRESGRGRSGGRKRH
jgi:hypothetical protein